MRKEVSLFGGLEGKAQLICDAAIKIFKKKSFDKMTVSEIAAVAQVGKGTFYLYFKSKEDLLNFLIEYGIDKLISYVLIRIEGDWSLAKKLERAIDAQLEFFNEYRDYCSFFIREIWYYQGNLKEQTNKFKEKYLIIFEDIIKEGIKQGSLKNINVTTVSSGLFGFLSLSSIQGVLFSQEFSTEDSMNSIKKVFFEGILTE